MKYIFALRHRSRLAELARDRALLAFDFDGTLAPITSDRDAARMRAGTRDLFTHLCKQYPVAVISGRSLADLTSRLDGALPAHVVGNHGIEPGVDLARFARVVAAVCPLLAASLADFPCVELENKAYSVALHYRRSQHPLAARQAILAAIATLPEPLRVVEGKAVINGLPWQASNKGDALLRICEVGGARNALYVGDDITDEDVFVLDRPANLLTIRVGRAAGSAARYFLRSQREIDLLLEQLIELTPSNPR